MGCEGYSSDFLADTAVSVGMPASFPQDAYINVVSCLGNKGFENKEAGRIGSFEHSSEFSDIDKFIKDENGVGMEEVQLKFLEEQDDFPKLSPLRDDCKGTFSCDVSRGSMDLISTVSRNDSGCENSYLASSRLSVGGPLEEDSTSMEVDENLVNKVGGFNCLHLSSDPVVALGVSDGVWMEGKNASLLGAQSHMPNFESNVENVTCMVERRKENDQENSRRMPFHYVRKHKEADKFNTLATLDGIGICEQVADEEKFRIPEVDFESCNRVQSSNKSAYFSSLQKNLSVKPSHSSTSFACYSGSIADPEIGANTSHAFKRSSIYCSKDDHYHGEAEKFSGVIAKTSQTTVVRRANPKRAASLKSSLIDETPNQLIRIKTDGRKCRGKVSTSTSYTPTVIGIFGEVKRKKRSSHRCPRHSIWGAFEKLFSIIVQKNEHVKHDHKQNDTLKRRPRKPRSGAIGTNKTAILKSQGSQFSITKRPPSIMSAPPLFVDAKSPLEDNINHRIPTSNEHFSAGASYKKVEFEQNMAERCGSVLKSNTRERQLGEKDLESTLTQETSADNLLSECHGVSSRIDVEFASKTVPCKKSFDSGNSPDSDVYNPHVDFDACTHDGFTSIKLEGVMDQNTLIQETKVEDNLPSATLNFNKPFVDPFSALAKRTKMRQDPSKAKSKKGQQRKKKNEKRQKKENREKKLRNASRFNNFPTASSSHPSISKNLEVLGRLEKEQRTSLSSVCSVNDEEALGVGGGKPKSVKKEHSKRGFKSELSLVNSSVLGLANLDFFDHSFGAHNNTETRTNPLQNDGDGLLESILPIDDIQSCGGRRSVKTRVSKRTFSLACSLRHTRKLRCGQQKRIQKSEKVLGIDAYPTENGLISDPSRTNDDSSSQGGHIHGETAMSDALLEDASNDVAVSVLTKLSARERYNILLGQFSLSGKKAWALCDECQKWRCVPDELVSIIEKSKWTCQDNVDEAFADCTVPQEKTDEAINRDLGILEEEDFSMAQNTCGEIALRRQSAAARPTWTLIKSNIFLHRSRRSQTIDEIMVCQCNTRPGGSLGCGEECLNRMLNIECVRGTCPCGDLCSNQQFQRRRYAKFKWIKCGKKGYGLQLEEDVLKGQFLIEYVGEVLDLAAYEARLKNYACRGQKHFYFMTLNGGEVIDACDKGNLGRFINHSCDPNCRTEKWMVNGEVCIGLFAIRDIKKGEEVTFDYNYVRVFGAAAKRCICGSADCRGYIGGDPSNSEVIVQDDSDGEDVEPLMVDAAGENRFGVVEANFEALEAKAVRHENVSVNGNDFQVNPVISDAMHCPSSKLKNDDLLQSAVLMCSASEHQPLQDTQLALAKVEPDQAASEPLDVDTMPSISRSSSHGQLCGRSRHSMDTLHADQVVQTSISADPTKFLSKTSDAVTSKKKLTTSVDEENSTSKSSIAMKSLHPVKVKRSMATIKTVASVKTKKVSNTICNRHIEGVEEKLNELLDDDGGIRRQKDAAKGYLKLLVVTSAAGDEISGSVSQSARDLSLILDAILKTKSRMVLVDIINKNGLQMLHKMLKQNNDNFNRIPILRKLLKVLEFLAEKQILSRDLINAAAPCSRMESFKESMLKLMKHRDSQIQVSARNFSNQWIPRTIRTMKPSDRDDPQMSIKRRGTTKFKSSHEQAKWETDAIVCVNATNSFSTSPSEVDNFGCSASFADSNPEGTRIRKRKSRWDQPAEVDLGFSQASQCSGDQLVLDSIKKPCLQLGAISNSNIPRQTPGAWSERNNSSHETTTESIQHDVEDGEMPPGFESPCIDEHCTNSSSMGEVVIAHPQERYLPHLPISYGMPLLLMQQLGNPEIEVSNEFGPSFGIAPSFPFKPFPPLPTYPRKDPNGENSTINACAIRPQVKEKAQQEKTCTPSNERALCHSNGNGRRFSQWPRHWNNQRSQRCPPNWLQGGNAFRFEGGSRNRVRNLDSGNSRMDGCGGFNPSQGVNNAYFRSKFNRKDCYHN